MKGDSQITLVASLSPAVLNRVRDVLARFSFAAPFVVTDDHFAHNNIDAVMRLQSFLEQSGIHDYERQQRGERVEVLATYVGYSDQDLVEQQFYLPFYRPPTVDKNWKRFSITKDVLHYAQVDDCLIFAQRPDLSLVLINLTRGLEVSDTRDPRWVTLLETACGLEDLPKELNQVGSLRAARQGRIQDAVLRQQIEQYAVRAAISFYENLGAHEIEEVGKPYDLRMKVGADELRAEVKGSVNLIDRVLVTVNEVAHASDFGNVDLVVVDGITRERNDRFEWVLSGGRFRRWANWDPSDDTLRPLTFEHTIQHALLDSEYRLGGG